jgi:hypothetical protein
LPADYTTIYRLSTLPVKELEARLADGSINPEMQRSDVPVRIMTVTVVEPETPEHTTKILPASPVSASAAAFSVASNPALPSRVRVSVGPNPALPSPSFTVIRSGVDHLIDLLEQCAELKDRADEVAEAVRKLDVHRQLRVREGVAAVVALKARLDC